MYRDFRLRRSFLVAEEKKHLSAKAWGKSIWYGFIAGMISGMVKIG